MNRDNCIETCTIWNKRRQKKKRKIGTKLADVYSVVSVRYRKVIVDTNAKIKKKQTNEQKKPTKNLFLLRPIWNVWNDDGNILTVCCMYNK